MSAEHENADESIGLKLLHSERETKTELGSLNINVHDDLDYFFSKVYNYFLQRGFKCILISRFTNLVTVAFTIFLSTFLFLFVDWLSIMDCKDRNDDTPCFISIRHDILVKPSFWEIIIVFYFVIFSLYWLWNFVSFFYSIRDGLEMRSFFRHQLNINDIELQRSEWPYVIDRLVRLQESGIRLCVVKNLSALDITNRIMRKENYMIALINMGLLDLHVPCLTCFHKQSTSVSLSKVLEWNIRFCVLNNLFDSDFTVRQSFLRDANSLKNRFFMMGLLNFVLMPFILIFMIILFFLKHAEELHSKRSYLGPDQWTPVAFWKLRNFNELIHFLHMRLTGCDQQARDYLDLFPARSRSLLARGVAFIAGACIAVLLLMTLIDSTLLTKLEVWNRPLLWHLAVLSGILAISRALIVQTPVVYEPERAMKELATRTHYFPAQWKGKCHTEAVHKEFQQLYQPKTIVFIQEIFSVFVTPFILCFSLPHSAKNIIDFIRKFTVYVQGVGEVCGFAIFDFNHYGQKNMAPFSDHHDNRGGSSGGNNDMDSASPTSTVEQKEKVAVSSPTDDELSYLSQHELHRKNLLDGNAKMEKSFLTFAINHPHWESPESGSRLMLSLASLFANQPPHEQPVEPEYSPSSTFGLGRHRNLSSKDSLTSTINNIDDHHQQQQERNNVLSNSNLHLVNSFSQLLRAHPIHPQHSPTFPSMYESRVEGMADLYGVLDELPEEEEEEEQQKIPGPGSYTFRRRDETSNESLVNAPVFGENIEIALSEFKLNHDDDRK